MVELSSELKQLILEDPQHAIEVAEENYATLTGEKPKYPGGGYSQTYMDAARSVIEAVVDFAEVVITDPTGTVYEAATEARM